MIIVTGGAGFIGSNIVKGLNRLGYNDIIVVDHLKEGAKFANLVDCEIMDYLDKEEFLHAIHHGRTPFKDIQAVFHEGACSDTTEWNGHKMMENNYAYSKAVFHYCTDFKIPLLYASSAAVYGNGQIFKEDRELESPLNIYGYSKFLFDQYVRRHYHERTSQVVGFRYFNVYGPKEQHKDHMASVAYHLNKQIQEDGVVRLFEGFDGYGDGEQRRDFVYIDDVVDVNLWFLQNPHCSGIFNLGTGRSQPFKDVAQAVIDWHQKGRLEFIPFPKHLKGRYQNFTQADISRLREVGYDKPFLTVEQGVKRYLDCLHGKREIPSKEQAEKLELA